MLSLQAILPLGPQVYAGIHVPQWGEHICNSCLASNWDGIVPQTWPHVVPILKAKGVEVTLNARGWIDIPA
jgi:hypothetical protein